MPYRFMPSGSDEDVPTWLRSGAMTVPKSISMEPYVLARSGESLSSEEHQARYREIVRKSVADFEEVLKNHGPAALRETVDALRDRWDELQEAVSTKRNHLGDLDRDHHAWSDMQEATLRMQQAEAMLELRHAVADAVLYQWLTFSEVDVGEITSAITCTDDEFPSLPPGVRSPSSRVQEICRTITSVTKERPKHLLEETQLKDLFRWVAIELDGVNSEDAWRTPYGTLHEWTKRNLGPNYWTGDAPGIVELAKRLTEDDHPVHQMANSS